MCFRQFQATALASLFVLSVGGAALAQATSATHLRRYREYLNFADTGPRSEHHRFDYGWLGLLGLLGLGGLMRRERVNTIRTAPGQRA